MFWSKLLTCSPLMLLLSLHFTFSQTDFSEEESTGTPLTVELRWLLRRKKDILMRFSNFHPKPVNQNIWSSTKPWSVFQESYKILLVGGFLRRISFDISIFSTHSADLYYWKQRLIDYKPLLHLFFCIFAFLPFDIIIKKERISNIFNIDM